MYLLTGHAREKINAKLNPKKCDAFLAFKRDGFFNITDI